MGAGGGPAQGKGAIGVGPLRLWPGGLCLSRAIGDFDVGKCVLSLPYVCQVSAERPYTALASLRCHPCLTAVSRASPAADCLLVCMVSASAHLTLASQVMLPPEGSRLIVASDGVWDAFEKTQRVSSIARSAPTQVRTGSFSRALWERLRRSCILHSLAKIEHRLMRPELQTAQLRPRP